MISRRRFAHCSACASGAWLLGCKDDPDAPFDAAAADAAAGDAAIGDAARADAGLPDGADSGPACDEALAGGTLIGVVPFIGNDRPLEMREGQAWDGRLSTDLSKIPEQPVTPNETYYLRTFDPDLLDRSAMWSVSVDGLVDAPAVLSLDDFLAAETQDFGVHVMECSGNGGPSFGLMSAARWGGVSVTDVLARLPALPSATGVEISGFDDHSVPSVGGHSTPGASWIFNFEQLANAFFATEMNGQPLPNDHGAPVRLYVPGWYGCCCIKWVNAIRFVEDTAPSTSLMREFAGRTHQAGTPELASDFLPASMDQAAMPVRVEKWRVDAEIVYRVYGILWGGYEPTDALVFGWGPNDQLNVNVCPPQTTNATWTVWQQLWRPAAPGEYTIRMRIEDDAIPTRRLDEGYYARRVVIDEV